MIDGYSTTFDWQQHPTRICVSAVGAFEQHSHHLPLETDAICGDYFARKTAELLDAALLPTLRIATSLEHSGFRGSFSLQPETLMQIIRDLAGELERQHFNRWVLINCHGGNSCLTSVVRDINRQDSGIKILLTACNEFVNPELAVEHRKYGSDIHAGERETSLMLAIAPETVRGARQDMTVPTESVPLRQLDLTHFGTGGFAPEGAVGWPSLANAEKGRRIVESIEKNMLAYIRDRLQRFDRCERYSGAGGIAVRHLVRKDIMAAVELSGTAGWNQLATDWETFLKLDPDNCFAAVHNGRVVGTTTALRYGDDDLAWIGMVLVDPAFRRLGVATRLMRTALEALQNVAVVGLDATAAGAKVYEQLGFVPQGRILRMICQQVHTNMDLSTVLPVAADDIPAIAALDADNFGAQRGPLLQRLFEATPELAWKLQQQDRILAFCLGRPGVNFLQIGPLLAETDEQAATLLKSVFTKLKGRSVALDVPAEKEKTLQMLMNFGFCQQREFLRMTKGGSNLPKAMALHAIAGPELG